MASSYFFGISIISKDETVSEKEFREQVEPCLTYLSVLSKSFGSHNCISTFHPPSSDKLEAFQDFWSVRSALMISLGKQRAESLIELYKAIYRLISFELPDFDILSEIKKIDVS